MSECPECGGELVTQHGYGLYQVFCEDCDYSSWDLDDEAWNLSEDDTQPILTDDWDLEMQYEDRYLDE